MLIDFNDIQETVIANLNGGDGVVKAKMFMQPSNKIMLSCLPKGASIGKHVHKTSSEMNYVLSGFGVAVCDDVEEVLEKGTCQYCQKGSTHSIINTGDDDLLLFTVVTEQ